MKTPKLSLKTLWLLSLCDDFDDEAAYFHFRGYVEGEWIKKVSVRRCIDRPWQWETGSIYLVQMEVLEIATNGVLIGRLKTEKKIQQEILEDF